MIWLLLLGWLAIALVVSIVCGRVLGESRGHHARVDGASVARVANQEASAGTR
jgi:hypothetical protein